jgi:purine-binding chemotaxis protein CheW
MADVAEVIHVPVTTRVPGVPEWLVGVANWRGHVLPILDLRPLLGAEAVPPTTSARVVVIAVNNVEAGVLADQVPGPLAEQEWECLPVPATASATAADLLAGAVLDDQGPVCLLDVAGLVALGGSLAGR